MGTVGLVVAGLGIMNTQLMSVMERYQEIGIYKALGASDGDVRVLFLTEAVVLGAVGGLGGLVLALRRLLAPAMGPPRIRHPSGRRGAFQCVRFSRLVAGRRRGLCAAGQPDQRGLSRVVRGEH